MTYRTWNEFWGWLLLVRFHRDNPERWSRRQARAERLWEVLALSPHCRILDLGCGDGILDICLARQGARVTAVDRIAAVLEAARALPGGDTVRFVPADLRQVGFEDSSFDAALMFDAIGLMGREDDASLLRRTAGWLLPGGQFAVDVPPEPATSGGESRWECEEGVLTIRWTYDATTRLQHIVPRFATRAGQTLALRDPYDLARGEQEGVLRYLYPQEEVRALLSAEGLVVRDEGALDENGRPLLIGRKL